MKYFFSRRTQLDKHLSDKFKFESVEMGVEADTKEEAEKEVKQWIDEYFKRCKAKLVPPNSKSKEEKPF